MLRVRLGDVTAFEALVRRHLDPVRRFLFRWLGERETAEDLAQEVFLRAFRARARYRPTAKFTTWLFTIAVNLARTQARRRQRHPVRPARGGDVPPEQPTTRDGPATLLGRQERAEQIRAAVAALPPGMRTPLVLSFYQGLRYREIADILGCTENAVKLRLLRARQALQERLAGWVTPSRDGEMDHGI